MRGGGTNFVSLRKKNICSSYFEGTNQYKKEDKTRCYLFYSPPIQICTFVQEMAILPIGTIKCEVTFYKLKCLKNRLRSTMGQERLNPVRFLIFIRY